MKTSALHSGRAALFTLSALALLTTSRAAQAQTVATMRSLHSFGGAGGSFPVAGLVTGADGGLYGITSNGGDDSGDGTVFKFMTNGAVTTLHAFGGGDDGSQPFAGLVLAHDGNVYGTTSTGGDTNGDGTIFKVASDGTLTAVHAFNGADGAGPQSGLLQAGDGTFYGTTTYGGASGNGTVFKMTADGTLSTLYSFAGTTDGSYPAAGLVMAADGNLYGTTSDGGSANGTGTVFRLTPAGALTTLHTFIGTDGYQPVGKLTVGNDGNLYGTTNNGGDSGFGTIFRITTGGDLTTVRSFSGGNDGAYPFAGLVLGADGNFYGTTSAGGDAAGDGTVFQLTPDGTVTTLCLFSGSDGSQPQTALVVASDGTLYGTTSGGGDKGEGTIFQVNVGRVAPFFSGASPLGSDVYYLGLANGNPFGYYAFLSDFHYVYHYDMGWEYVFDAADGHAGVYLYDFASSSFFYTSPDFPFPYLYDFASNSVLYYFPDQANPGRYTSGPRYFYDYGSGRIITK